MHQGDWGHTRGCSQVWREPLRWPVTRARPGLRLRARLNQGEAFRLEGEEVPCGTYNAPASPLVQSGSRRVPSLSRSCPWPAPVSLTSLWACAAGHVHPLLHPAPSPRLPHPPRFPFSACAAGSPPTALAQRHLISTTSLPFPAPHPGFSRLILGLSGSTLVP